MSEQRGQREHAASLPCDRPSGGPDVEKLLPMLRMLIYLRHEAETLTSRPVDLIGSIDEAIEEARKHVEQSADAAVVCPHGLN